MATLDDLCSEIMRLTARGPGSLPVEGAKVFSADRTTRPLGDIVRPALAVVAQGAKRTVVGDRVFDYRAGQYLVVTVDVPVTSQITRASTAEPFLAFGLALKPSVIVELLLQVPSRRSRQGGGAGVVMSDADELLLDPIVRLLRLMDRPDDARVLGAAVEREIHWRLLTGPHGATVRQVGLANSGLALVARAVEWLQARYDQPIRISDLADHVGLSAPALNRHFRAATAMSPLQYQKQLRLQQARMRLVAGARDIAEVGHAVGYSSPSQFSREYRRLFGVPPGQDATRLQGQVLADYV
ncbi:AraC family transcriptional regulator [Streptomyces malaysiensis subsp. malaysiensis]|uniref:AraC family transcriptional regulator n=1 Tax=Streptomyces malaysiensis TaxID=92644 RepID=UPI0024BFE74F|nr:AraC family transcriptional regulator [Streptomyces sp. NA07423]WHX15967.1 AraC family transcriptional regulator [Streptomyces sp. NA07423]